MKLKHLPTILALLLTATMAIAGTIKTWSSGETLRSADLNSNFSHIHTTMVGGHGARLVNADVSASAAIDHSKMATPALFPKAWAAISSASCTSTPCTINASSGVTSITRSATGTYSVLIPARTNTAYGVMVQSVAPSGATATTMAVCYVEPIISTTTIAVDCFKNDGTGAQDTGFTILILDNDN